MSLSDMPTCIPFRFDIAWLIAMASHGPCHQPPPPTSFPPPPSPIPPTPPQPVISEIVQLNWLSN